MSLLFGRLTQDFVVFGSDVMRAQQGDTTAAGDLPAAAAAFKHSAALNASYLVYIGERLPPALSCVLVSYMKIDMETARSWHVRLHLYLHGCLGLHWRGQCETTS